MRIGRRAPEYPGFFVDVHPTYPPRSQIEYLRRVSASYPLPLAWKYEALGDVLAGAVSPKLHPDYESLARVTQAMPQISLLEGPCEYNPSVYNLTNAKAAYATAYRLLCGCYGEDSEFAQEAKRKLDSVERLMHGGTQ